MTLPIWRELLDAINAVERRTANEEHVLFNAVERTANEEHVLFNIVERRTANEEHVLFNAVERTANEEHVLVRLRTKSNMKLT